MKKSKGKGPPKEDRWAPNFNIDPEGVKGEYTHVAPQLALLNEKYAQASATHIMAKHLRDVAYATVYAEITSDAAKKPAEATIKNMILLDDRYQTAVQQYAAAEKAKLRAWGDCDAMRSKKEMLISLGATIRAEQGGQGGTQDTDPDQDEDDED